MVKVTTGNHEMDDDDAQEQRVSRAREEIMRHIDSFLQSTHAMLVIKRDRDVLLFEETKKTRVQL